MLKSFDAVNEDDLGINTPEEPKTAVGIRTGYYVSIEELLELEPNIESIPDYDMLVQLYADKGKVQVMKDHVVCLAMDGETKVKFADLEKQMEDVIFKSLKESTQKKPHTMQKLKRFSAFLNEADESYYKNEGYVTDEAIPDMDTLVNLVTKNISAAFKDFCAAKGLDKVMDSVPDVIVVKDMIKLGDNKVSNIGVFANVLNTCALSFFSGRKITASTQEGQFYFKPQIWTSLDISYAAKNGGTNGMSYPLDGNSNDMWYDIVDAKWYTISEMNKKVKTNESVINESTGISLADASLPDIRKRLAIYNTISGSTFETWYNRDFTDHMEGAPSDKGKEKILVDIARIFHTEL